MAVFIDIRNKLGPILVILIGFSLVVFILQAALDSNSSLLTGNRDVVGVIDGEKIHYNDYIAKVEDMITSFKLNNQGTLDDNTTYSIREQAWTQMIQDRINNDLYDKLGITISEAEMKDMFFGNDPNPEIKKTFTNPNTGIFDPAAVKNYISMLDRSTNGEDVNEKRTRWINFERYVNDDRLSTKLRTAFKSGVYIPKWYAENTYNEKNVKFSFDYVAIPYSSIADSTIKISDEEIQAYINKNKEKFKQEESRKIEYVVITVKPSAADTEVARSFAFDALAKLSAPELDTNFVKLNADRALDELYYSEAAITKATIKPALFSQPVGSIIGPIQDDADFVICKIIDRQNLSDSVKASHILFSTQGVTDTLRIKNRADSVLNLIRNGAVFEELAKTYSDDKGSGEKGGELGYIKQGMTVKPFNNFLFFTGNQGDMKLVKTEFGYHIIKLIESAKNTPHVRYYSFTRKVEASSKTDKGYFEQANKFASKYNTPELFEKAFKDNPTYIKSTGESIRKNDYQLPNLNGAREVITWAFKNEVGSISPVFSAGENYVIAHLVEIREKGTQSVNVARAQVEPILRNLKKGAKIAAELAAAGQMNTTLESISSKYSVEVKPVPETNFADSYISGIGVDNALIGNLAKLKENTVSAPIIGNNAVYLVKMLGKTTPAPVADYNNEKMELSRNIGPRIEFGLTDALRKSLEVEDLRYNFF